MPELSIVIPCLNEAASLGLCLQKANTFLSTHHIDGEVIVADNCSSDGSRDIAIANNAIVITEEERGYGCALRAGIGAASGRYVIMGDADDSYDFSAMLPLLLALRNGAELVMGNRFKGTIHKGAMPFLHRYLGNPVLSFIGRLFFRIPVGDFYCGLRGFSIEAYRKMDLKTKGMEFALEMIVKAAFHQLRIAEVPIDLYKDQRNRPSHLRTWHDGWKGFRFLLLFSPRWLFLYPGIALFFFGLLGSGLLIAGPVIIDGKRFDVHTLMYTSASILLGFQFISLYFFSRIFTTVTGLLPVRPYFLGAYQKYFTLERGIFFGIALIAGGLYLNIRSLLYWRSTGFSNLDPFLVLRWVIPSVVLLVMGVQLILSFFYASILRLRITSSLTKDNIH